MRINYSLDGLRALIALHQTQSFVQAARVLHITQPALTRRLQMLEQAIQGRLADRTTRAVTFTPLGLWLVERVKGDVQALDTDLATASRMAQGELGDITFACLTTVAYAWAPRVLERFHVRYPKVRALMLDDTGQRVLASVRNGQAEFGIGIQPGDPHGLVCETLCDDPFVLAMPPNHHMARRRKLRWRELEGQPVVALRQTSANRHQIDRELEAAGLQTPWFDEVEHLSSLMGRVQGSMTLAVVPQLALQAAPARSLRSIPLTEPRIARRVMLIRREAASLSPVAAHLWELFADALKHALKK